MIFEIGMILASYIASNDEHAKGGEMNKGMLSASLGLLASSLLFGGTVRAAAIEVDVFAMNNSFSGGAPLSSISLVTGDLFEVSVDPTDIWSAGALPRWSNADGLIVDLFATGSDESGQPAGTRIGAPFASFTADGFTAPYGALVGRIGGTYLLLGTSYSGSAPETGTLELFYWDSNSGDNQDSVHVTLTSDMAPPAEVPEPGGLLLFGLGLAGFLVTWRQRLS
jgi:hypothetical protein